MTRSISALIFVLAAASASCGGAQTRVAKPLPTYDAKAARAFDDAIDAAAVGLDIDNSYDPKADRGLRERAQSADAVLRVKVATVTGRSGPSYDLGLKNVEWLAGDHAPGMETFAVTVGADSPALGIVKSFEGRLVAKDFIAFVRAFQKEGGERQLHFHLSPDTPAVRAAVSDAVTLRAFK